MFKVVPLFSSSSGNSVYVKYGDDEILIDAGASCKMIEEALNIIGSSLMNIKAVFVTHEHSDHVRGLEAICKKYNIPVYIDKNALDGIAKIEMREAVKRCAELCSAGDTVNVGEICANIFKTPHDACSSVGYRFNFSDGSAFGYATDIGYITRGIASNLFGCDTVVLESNHDTQMLVKGPYPYYLKQRILSDKGHLSNEACSEFVPHLYSRGTKKVILAHLSEHNNTPELAYNTSVSAAEKAGISRKELEIKVAMKSIL